MDQNAPHVVKAEQIASELESRLQERYCDWEFAVTLDRAPWLNPKTGFTEATLRVDVRYFPEFGASGYLEVDVERDSVERLATEVEARMHELVLFFDGDMEIGH